MLALLIWDGWVKGSLWGRDEDTRVDGEDMRMVRGKLCGGRGEWGGIFGWQFVG